MNRGRSIARLLNESLQSPGGGPAYAGLRSLYKAGLFAVFDLQIVFWGRQGVLTTEAANSSDPAILVLSERRLMYGL